MKPITVTTIDINRFAALHAIDFRENVVYRSVVPENALSLLVQRNGHRYEMIDCSIKVSVIDNQIRYMGPGDGTIDYYRVYYRRLHRISHPEPPPYAVKQLFETVKMELLL